MAIKYRLEYKDVKQNSWKVDIDFPDYTGDVVQLVGDGNNPLTIEWGSNSSDDPHAQHVIASNAKLRVYSQGIDLNELMLIDTDEYRVKIYLNSALFWSGYLLSDGVQKNRETVTYPITLTATDGLDRLDGVNFTWSNSYREVTVNGLQGEIRTPLNAMRDIFGRTILLNNPLPIRWMNSNKSDEYPLSDGLAGQEEIDEYGDLTRVEKSCYWWLDNLLKSQYCWLRQINGYWYIVNQKDLIANDGIFNGWEISSATGQLTAVSVTEDLNRVIDTTIHNDGYTILKKAVSTVDVEYVNTTNKNNVVPNPSFDLSSIGVPLFWGMKSGDATKLSLEDALNINNEGKSAQVDNSDVGDTDDWLTFASIPLDTNVLFKNATLGFTWVGISGYTLTEDTGAIRTDIPQIGVSVKYTIPSGTWYLNEYGYWWNSETAQSNAKITSTSFISNAFSISFDINKPFYPGDRVLISVTRGGILQQYNYTFNELRTVTQGLDDLSAYIPNSGSVSSYTLFIYDSQDSLSNNAVMAVSDFYSQNIFIDLQNTAKLNDVVEIQFQSKGASSQIKMPDCGDLVNAVNNNLGNLSVEILSKAGTVMRVDDVYFKVEDNNDYYTISKSGKGSKKEYQLEISSSFSGHLHSSYMKSYSTADESMLWNGGKTLSEWYGINALDRMATPTQIFQGTAVGLYNGHELFEIDGIKYTSLGCTLDCHSRKTKLYLFEAKNFGGSYTVVHKSSEDV